MNKRADKIISIYWFAILFIIAGAIVYMTFIFYGQPFDARELEANLLTNQIADCLSYSGELKQPLFDEEQKPLLTNDNFLEKCKLILNVEDVSEWKDDQIYIEVNFYNFNSTQNTILKLEAGNINLKQFCVEEYQKQDNFPKCKDRKLYVVDDESKQYQVSILSIVKKLEKNVK